LPDEKPKSHDHKSHHVDELLTNGRHINIYHWAYSVFSQHLTSFKQDLLFLLQIESRVEVCV